MNDKWGNMPTLDRLKMMDTSRPPIPGTLVPCLLCAKPFLMPAYSGFPDQVCPDCYHVYADCAIVICKICKIAIAKVRPHMTESGFLVKPRMVLHSTSCSICSPGLAESTIIEVERWERKARPKKLIMIPGTDNVKKYS